MFFLDVSINFNCLFELSRIRNFEYHVRNGSRWSFENCLRAGVLNFHGKRCTCSLGIDWCVEGQRIRIMVSDGNASNFDVAWGIINILETHEAWRGSGKGKGHNLEAVGCLSDGEVCFRWLGVDSDFNRYYTWRRCSESQRRNLASNDDLKSNLNRWNSLVVNQSNRKCDVLCACVWN